MKHRPYPAYKDSGVEWLGEVPEHWEVKRLRFLAKTNPSKQEVSDRQRNLEVDFLPMEAVDSNGALRLGDVRKICELENGYTYFAEGDVSYAKITPCFENGKGAVIRGLAHGFGFGTTELTILRPDQNRLLAQFLWYITASKIFRDNGEAWMYGAGGQKRVPDEFAKNLFWGFPSLAEQNAICTFLDRVILQLDALVQEQRDLIELLREKRQSLISEAVTRGLDPTVPMKDSGVEWLGQVPAHWEVYKLSQLFPRIGSGTTPDTDTASYYLGGDIPWLNTGDLNDGSLVDCEKRVTELATQKYTSLKMYDPGSLVIAMYGATIGKLAIIEFATTVNQACCVFAPSSPYSVRLLFYWFLAFRDQVISLAIGGGQPNINQAILRRIQVAVPDQEEQRSIIAHLEAQTSKLDTLITEAEEAIALMLEHRAALISEAVTGKIDVRELV